MTKSKQKILIVEDELPVLDLLKNRFENESFMVITAKDGIEALAVAAETHPDMILLDILMPKMDGITMLKRLRLEKWGKEIPVIILTNLSDSGAVANALEKNVFDYLVKTDWTLEELVAKVKKNLEAPQPSASFNQDK